MSRQDKLKPRSEPEGSDDPDEVALEVALRLRLDEVADNTAELLRTAARRPPSTKDLRLLAEKIYKARRLRERIMDDDMFGEAAWDMLLALYFMPPQGEMLTVSGLCFSAGAVSQTTALRWESRLEGEGLLERSFHTKDRRMHLVRLTENGRALMTNYLTRLFFCKPVDTA